MGINNCKNLLGFFNTYVFMTQADAIKYEPHAQKLSTCEHLWKGIGCAWLGFWNIFFVLRVTENQKLIIWLAHCCCKLNLKEQIYHKTPECWNLLSPTTRRTQINNFHSIWKAIQRTDFFENYAKTSLWYLSQQRKMNHDNEDQL